MSVSVVKVVILSVFLFLGVVLAGVFMQPKASVDIWNIKEGDFPANGSSEDRLNFLLNYAILAPSSHNTQPWRFNVSGDEIRLFADRTKWLTVADADQRELHISLGCALENLLVAAEHFGYSYDVTYLPGNDSLVAVVKLTPGGKLTRDPRLFDAITARHTNRLPYEDRAVSKSALQTLQNQTIEEGIGLYTTSDVNTRTKFSDLVVSADQIQYADTNYKSELGHWLGQGLMGPTGAQAIIAQLTVLFLDVGTDQTKKDAELVNSTPVLGFISSKENDRISQVKAGQAFERVWLMATALGIRVHPMSQALELPETKAKLAGLMSTGSGYPHPQQTFRLGYAEAAGEHTPRRPIADVIVKGK